MSNITNKEAQLKAKLKACRKCVDNAERELQVVNEIKSGDRPSPDQLKRIKTQDYSFTVYFQCRKALRQVRVKGLVNKSQRRFGSRKEAIQHGKRFTKIWKHKGYAVVKVAKRANAWINWRTGKTNPVIGL